MKKLFLKSNQLLNNNNECINEETKPNINQNILNKLDLNNSLLQNKNNITVDYSQNQISSYNKSPLELPIKLNLKKQINKSKIEGLKRIMFSNSSSNIYSQNIFGLSNNNNKQLKKDKTEINLIKEENDHIFSNENINLNKNNNLNNNNISLINKNKEEFSLFKRKFKNPNNSNINNITNINIHIYSNTPQINNLMMQRNTANLNKKKNNIITSRDINNKQLNNIYINSKNNFIRNNSTIETISNINNKNNLFNLNNPSNILFPRNNNFNIRIQKQKRVSCLQKAQRKGHSSSVEGNKNSSLSLAGNIIMNNNKINLLSGNNRAISKENGNGDTHNNSLIYRNNMSNKILPEINLTQIDALNKIIYQDNQDFSVSSRNKTLNKILEEYEEINCNDIEKINDSKKFLIDLNLKQDKNNFIIFLKLFEIHMDIEIILNSVKNDNNNILNKNEINNPLRQKQKLFINNDKQYKLFNLINNYFNLLRKIYDNEYIYQTKIKLNNEQNDLCFFTFNTLNTIFKNCIKSQMCLFSSILISITQLPIFDFNIILKNYFLKIFKEISFSLYNIFEIFIKENLIKEYNDIIKENLKSDFFQNYNKLIEEHKTKVNKNIEILKVISNNIEKSINSLKFYSSSNLKYSLIKPYGDSLNQLLFSFDRKTLCQFADNFLNTILFGELELNKKKLSKTNEDNNNIINNGCGSILQNNIKEKPPYLPTINPKYKFTLVLDIDETMIHFFFTYINGMFFVRPYFFKFLNEMNEFYEIVTFTAGTKDYADNILNLLDINNNLIKYRLYRQHTTIKGCSVFKDLSKLGRDLNKIIIIDNLKDNFKLQPNNGLFIKTWTSDVNDNQFYDLGRILKDIIKANVNDVRPIIEKINDDIKISRNIINPYSNVDINKIVSNLNINK